MRKENGTKNTRVFANSILYSVTSLFTKAIGFFMLPFYTNMLETESYGSVDLVTGFVAVAVFISSLSLSAAILRFHSEYANDKEKLSRFYGTIFSFLPVSGLLFATACLLLREKLAEALFSGLPFFPMVLLAIGLTYVSVLHTAHLSVIQASQDGRRLSLLNICVCLAQVTVTVFLLTVWKLGAAGILLSQFIVYALYSVYAYIDLAKRGYLRFAFDWKMLKTALGYSVPMLPHNLSGNIADYASKLFLSSSVSLSGVGLYGAASKFGLVIDTIQTAGNQAFMPWFFEELKNDAPDRENIGTVTRTLLTIYSFMYLCIGLFSEEVICVALNESYRESWRVIPIIVAAFSVKSVYYFLVNVLMYHTETARRIFVATISGSLSEILMLSFLVPLYGMYGTALSLLLAKIVTVAIIAHMAKPYKDLPMGAFRLFLCVLPSLLFLAAGSIPAYILPTGLNGWCIAIKFAVLFAYICYTLLANKDLAASLKRLLSALHSKKVNKGEN